MDLVEFVRCGTLAHGHLCPPLVLGVRAGALAMERLGVGRAVERELFAFVELGGDHYAQGFADGIQFVTGCTFGKDLIFRFPHGKAGVQLLDQVRDRAVRVTPRPETIARLEASAWFRACQTSGRFGPSQGELARQEADELLAAPADELFQAGPVFPLGVDRPIPSFDSVRCEACGESVLAAYSEEVEGRRLCTVCAERLRAIRP